jgi:hypothetical protein
MLLSDRYLNITQWRLVAIALSLRVSLRRPFRPIAMIIKFIAAAALISLVGCGFAPTESEPAATTPAETEAEAVEPATETIVTMVDYEAITEGMTLAEVEELIGPGEEMSSSEFEGITTSAVMWQNPDFSNLVLTIQNGEVASKAQSMLK